MSINPAPCAEAMMNDQTTRSRKPTRMPTQFGWRERSSRYIPKAKRSAAAAIFRLECGKLIRASRTIATMMPTESACPRAMGGKARNTGARFCSCKPRATANNPPMAADRHHLRPAGQRLLGILRMRRPVDDPADAHGAGFFRVKWIGDIVLQHFAGAPT